MVLLARTTLRSVSQSYRYTRAFALDEHSNVTFVPTSTSELGNTVTNTLKTSIEDRQIINLGKQIVYIN